MRGSGLIRRRSRLWSFVRMDMWGPLFLRRPWQTLTATLVHSSSLVTLPSLDERVLEKQTDVESLLLI